MHLTTVHFWTCSFLELYLLSAICLLTVIGGKNVYLRLNMTGECDNEDSVWENLQNKVSHSVILQYNMEGLFIIFPLLKITVLSK